MKHVLLPLLRVLALLVLLEGPVYAVYCIWRYWPEVHGQPARK